MDRPPDLALEAEQRSASAEPVARAANDGVARVGLFRKYLLLFIGLVSAALLANAAVELAFAYRDSRALLARLQLEKVDIAKERIEQFIGDIQRQLEWTTTAQFAAQTADERRLQFVLLLRQAPAITGISQLDAGGREQLKVSRIALDAVGSQADFSHDPAFTEALAHKVWFSPVLFRQGSEPYLTLALAGTGRRPGVTVAEVNLKLIWDVITAMKIGQAGYAYVVDRRGRLIAHPDMSLVLRDTSFSALPQVAEGLGELQAPDQAAAVPVIERNFDGRRVLSAHAALPALGWLVFVELPMAEALAPLYASALHTVLVLVAGLALATLAAWFVVRRMTGPIGLLEAGAARIGAGDLDARIEVQTGDELETLANQFNNMAGQLKQSYAGLERKVAERTAQLDTRNRAFAEQVEHQAATIDVLKVMSSSSNDTAPVFDIIVRRAMQLCDCVFGGLFEFDGELLHVRTAQGFAPDALADLGRRYPRRPTGGALLDLAILEKRLVHSRDVDAEPARPEGMRNAPYRSYIAVPLLREGLPIGAIGVGHAQIDGFTDAHIELLKTFAEQAVIAIGSVATFKELQERTAELTRSVAELQALEEVLRAVNSSLDLQTVLATIIERAVPLAQADEGMIYEFDAAEQVFVPKAAYGMTADRIAALRERRIRVGETYLGRSAAERVPIAVDDVQQDPSTPYAKELLQGIHAALAVPLMREDSVVGGLVVRRRSDVAFNPATVSLMQTFAAQSVVAIENARLFQEAERARAAAEAALNDLRRAQDRLVQSEKMASLGQLTAGIAHEIKNPLNFVNNFSALSTELIDELRGVLAGAAIDGPARAEVEELSAMIKGNLEKVVQHGKRADGIVKNMLLHARESGGERRSVDLNAIVDEALGLAYHGARAEKPGFNITLERDFDPKVGALEIYPQEFTRVILNLCTNGFYAATRKAEQAGAGFQPTLTVATESRPDAVLIRVRDNGTGIPESARARLFEPFFTTKPAGEGTGLGLSLSHDIVVKQHGGSIAVESMVGKFTEFTVTLPRRSA